MMVGRKHLTLIKEETDVERSFKNKLRQVIMNEIKSRNLDNQQLAKIFGGMLPSGVDLLMNRNWSMEVGIRIALALNLDVILDIYGEYNG